MRFAARTFALSFVLLAGCDEVEKSLAPNTNPPSDSSGDASVPNDETLGDCGTPPPAATVCERLGDDGFADLTLDYTESYGFADCESGWFTLEWALGSSRVLRVTIEESGWAPGAIDATNRCRIATIDAQGNETSSTTCTFVGEVAASPGVGNTIEGTLTVTDEACETELAIDTAFDVTLVCL